MDKSGLKGGGRSGASGSGRITSPPCGVSSHSSTG